MARNNNASSSKQWTEEDEKRLAELEELDRLQQEIGVEQTPINPLDAPGFAARALLKASSIPKQAMVQGITRLLGGKDLERANESALYGNYPSIPELKSRSTGEPSTLADEIAGGGAEMVLDPFTYGPGLIGKVAPRAAILEKLTQPSNFAISKTGQIIENTGPITRKMASTFTGVPEDLISTYFNRNKQINDIIQKSGGDMTIAADEMRQNWLNKLRSKKDQLGSTIGSELSKRNSYSQRVIPGESLNLSDTQYSTPSSQEGLPLQSIKREKVKIPGQEELKIETQESFPFGKDESFVNQGEPTHLDIEQVNRTPLNLATKEAPSIGVQEPLSLSMPDRAETYLVREHPIAPIVSRLEAAKSRLDPNLQKDAVAQIQDMIDTINNVGENGYGNLEEINKIKNYLFSNSKGSYYRGGQLFTNSKDAANAAKYGAGEATQYINKVAPEVKEANRQLSRMHFLEERMNKNLINPETPEGALMAAGSGMNPRNSRMLKSLGQVIGEDLLSQAKDLSTAKAFANPSVLPVDTTGKSWTRIATGTGMGTAVGAGVGGIVGNPVLGGKIGGTIGAAMSSPTALKMGINTIAEPGQKALPLIEKAGRGLQSFAKTGGGIPYISPITKPLPDAYLRLLIDRNIESPWTLMPKEEEQK